MVMQIFSHSSDLSIDFPDSWAFNSLGVTIGTFDGFHLGHRSLFDELRKQLGDQGKTLVVTFREHPCALMAPDKMPACLSCLDTKLGLLEKAGFDACLLLEFTEELRVLKARDFLQRLHSQSPFTKLVVGYDAQIGSDRLGGIDHLGPIGKELGFDVTVKEAVQVEGEVVSSSRIRKALTSGEFDLIQQLLGRDFSFSGKSESGAGRGRGLGYPTVNLSIRGLCLPPMGVYAVHVRVNHGEVMAGVANLGFAPSLQSRKEPVLETHLFTEEDIGEGPYQIEIWPRAYLRPERRFETPEALQSQISKDCAAARKLTMN